MGIEFGVKDIIDILLVAFIMYQTFLLLKGTNAVNIFVGIIAFVVVWFFVSYVFKMQLLGAILDKLMSVGAIALIVIFKDEIRQFFSLIGEKRKLRFLKWLYKKTNLSDDINVLNDNCIKEIVWACNDMSAHKCGALIIIKQNADLANYEKTGETINSAISSRLIENIFFKNSPLHDGAMIIAHNKIKSVACILPISTRLDIPKSLGLRHRAAIGITEKTDAIAIVVSEETGNISIMDHNSVKIDISTEQLTEFLSGKNKSNHLNAV